MGDNNLELDVYLQMHMGEIDASSFDEIKKAATNAGKEIEKAFSDGLNNVLGSLASLREMSTLLTIHAKQASILAKKLEAAAKSAKALVAALSGESTDDASKVADTQLKERERVLQEEQRIRRALNQQSVADEQKAAAERERVLQEEQKIRAGIVKKNSEEHIKNLAKISAGVIALKKAFDSLYTGLKKNIELTTKMTATVVKSFSTMLVTVTKFAAEIGVLPTILRGMNSALSSFSSKLRSAFSSIDFIGLAKESLMLSSSLTEIQNVINQVFGDGAKEINEFASNAIQQLGMTGGMAKQFAGKFGAAMRSTGQSAKDTVEMSKALTQLTSDIASFFDIEQDLAAEKLFSGVISGQVKPMRELGVDMTNASLSAYALSKGLSTSYSNMSAAEKQALRLQYVLEKLDYVQGDYARTINSTANQIRLLKNQFKELGSVVGSIINAFFNPFIITLNRVVAAITNVAKSIASIMGIDWTLGTGGGVSTLGGVSDSYDDLAESADGLAEAEDGVAGATDKAAKAAKKALAPFHKLNVLQNKTASDSSSGKGAGAGSGLYDIASAADGLEQAPINLKDAFKKLYDFLMGLDWDALFVGLAKKINELTHDLPEKVRGLFEALNALWAKIIHGFNEFLKELNTFDIGRVIGEVFKGIGDLIYTALTGIDFNNLGVKFAELMNGIFNTEGLAEVWGRNLGASIQNGFELALGFAESFDWANFGEQLYTFISSGLDEIDPETIYNSITKLLTGITTSLNEAFDKLKEDKETQQKIKDSIAALINAGVDYLGSDDFADLVINIAEFIADSLDTLSKELDKEENKEKVGKAIDALLEGAGKVLSSGENLASTVWDYVEEAIVKFFSSKEIPVPLKILAGVKLADITGLTNAFKGLFAVIAGFKIFSTLSKGVSTTTTGVSAMSKALTALKGVFTAIAPYITAVGALLAEFFLGEAGVQKLLGYDIEGSTFAEKWKSFWGNFAEITTNAWNNTKELFTTIIPGVFEGLGTVIDFALSNLGTVIQNRLSELGTNITEFFTPVKEAFDTAFNSLPETAATVWENIQTIWQDAATWFDTTVWQPITTAVSTLETAIPTFFNNIWLNIQTVWATVSEWFNTNIWTPLTTAASTLQTNVSTFFNNLWLNIQAIWSVVAQWFNDTIWTPITTAAQQLQIDVSTFFSNLWTDIQSVWGTVVTWFNDTVWTPLKEAVGELVDKVKEDFGGAVTTLQEKWNGFLSFFRGLYNTVKGWLDDLIQKVRELIDSVSNIKLPSIKLPSFNSKNSIRGFASGGVFKPNSPQLALLGDHKSQTEYALTTGHLQKIADMMANAIGSSGYEGNITIPIYVDGVLTDQKVITASQMHNYRSNGR